MIDAGLPVRAFFTSRDGGVSAPPYDTLNLATHVGDESDAVAINRARVSALAGSPVSFLSAEHGSAVAYVSTAGVQLPTADALVTNTVGVAIAAIAADCAPVLLHDSLTGAVAAIHAGREGLYLGVLDNAIAALREWRTRTDARGGFTASLGPTICGRCYEVPDVMRARVVERHPEAFSTTREGTPALDLPRAIVARLGELGVEQVVRRDVCTFEVAELFSHRRDGLTGRFAGVVVCE